MVRAADFNPFRVGDLPVPPNVALLVRLTAFALLLKGYYTGPYTGLLAPFAPLLPWFDRIPHPYFLREVMTAVLVAALLGILFDARRIRLWCLLAACTIFAGVLAARFYYSNNKIFCACLFLLASLSARGDRPVLFYAQLSVMYFGAALNKLLEPDWRSGQYFDYWLGTLNPQPAFQFFADRLPPLVAGQVMGWTTIAVEALLCLGFALHRWRVPAAWLGLHFHAGALLLAQRDFGVYTAAIMASYLVVVSWPAAVRVEYGGGSRTHALLRTLLRPLDFDRLAEWHAHPPARGGPFRLVADGRRHEGWQALQRLLLYHTVVIFAAFLVLAGSRLHYVWWRSAALVLWLVLFSPAWALVGRTRRTELARAPTLSARGAAPGGNWP
jgi:hypothetical protein